jgi:hypothetical protein
MVRSLMLEAMRVILIKLPAVVLTLAITWPQDSLSEEDCLVVAAQVYGGVRPHFRVYVRGVHDCN